MILNFRIISILIIIVPTSTNVCNFIGYSCSLKTVNASYFTQLDYLHDPEIGDSWLLQNDQSLLVSGRLVSDLLIPPDGPSPHCLMIRYSITGNALIRLIVIAQSDDYEVRFCYESFDEDGSVKKISVPFSMYSHTRITIDISMSSNENCVFYLESFWVVRDECYAGFKERMNQCPEYIATNNNGRLTTVTTQDSSELIIEMTSLQYNGTADQWNDNVTDHVNSSGIINTIFPTTISSTSEYAYNVDVNETIVSTESMFNSTPSIESELQYEFIVQSLDFTETGKQIFDDGKDQIKNETYQEVNKTNKYPYSDNYVYSSESNSVTNSFETDQLSRNITVTASSIGLNTEVYANYFKWGEIKLNGGNNEQFSFKNLTMIYD